MAEVKENEDLVQTFQNLQVLPAMEVGLYEMDSLAKDLNTALEEASKTKKGDIPKKQKRRLKKRRPSTTHQVSDCSDLSQEGLCGAGTFGTTQPSDSDDIALSGNNRPTPPRHSDKKSPASCKGPYHHLHLLSHTLSLAESDSFTENSPFRPHRRKRRFKRMAVDMDQDQSEFNVTQYLQEERMKRLQTFRPRGKSDMLRPPTPKRSLIPKDILMDSFTTSSQPDPVANVVSCKRKRGIKGSSSFEVLDEDTLEAPATGHLSTSESSLSSSCESDTTQPYDGEGVLADDEHSDWYYEPGPSSSVPVIVPWWEEHDAQGGDENRLDPDLKKILEGSLIQMSAAGRLDLEARLGLFSRKTGRPMRRGRRRLNDKKPLYSLPRFIQESQQQSLQGATLAGQPGQNGGNNSQDPKRRRKTPPVTPIDDILAAGEAPPLPSSNMGNHLLQQMGWTPGSGLGSQGSGILEPIQVHRRPGRKGLGS